VNPYQTNDFLFYGFQDALLRNKSSGTKKDLIDWYNRYIGYNEPVSTITGKWSRVDILEYIFRYFTRRTITRSVIGKEILNSSRYRII
jgi:hypothetical protein